jgi:hypothetical protein
MAALEHAKSHGRPLGGVPPLDPEKMRQVAGASAYAKGVTGPHFPPPPGTPEAGDLPMPVPPQLPPDQLPKREDIKGVGAGFAYNQAMARGEVEKPMTLAQARRMEERAEPSLDLKPTSRAKEILNTMVQSQTPGSPPPPQPDSAPAYPPAQAPAEAPTPNQETEADVVAADEAISKENLPEFFGNQFDEVDEVRRILLNPARRKEIESRVKPMDIADLILEREVCQTIPVVPGKFWMELRTIQGFENTFCLQKMYGVVGSDMYVQELLNMYKMTCALVSINGSPLPDHRVGVGTGEESVDETRFDHKAKLILGQATPILAEIGVQYDWFIVRVNKLFSGDNLKNG